MSQQGKDIKDVDKNVTKLELANKSMAVVPSLAHFASLTRLNLDGNALSGLGCIVGCNNLTWLSVSGNGLKGLEEVASLKNLMVLKAANNLIESLPNLSNLHQLAALVLNNNNLKTVPEHLPASVNSLVLSHNQITELAHLTHLEHLKKLSLACNQISSISDALVRNTALTELRMRGNKIFRVPPNITANVHLRLFDIGNNAIADRRGIQSVTGLHKLRNFSFKGNPICNTDKELDAWIKQVVPTIKIMEGSNLEKPKNKKGETSKNESAKNESAKNESAKNESAKNEKAKNESAKNEKAKNEKAKNEKQITKPKEGAEKNLKRPNTEDNSQNRKKQKTLSKAPPKDKVVDKIVKQSIEEERNLKKAQLSVPKFMKLGESTNSEKPTNASLEVKENKKKEESKEVPKTDISSIFQDSLDNVESW